MFITPLCPFFVLFCNVVATSDQQDFELIKKVTDDLRQFSKANASIGKLYGLFSKFLDLCAPLIKKNTASFLPDQNGAAFSGGIGAGEASLNRVDSYPDMLDRNNQMLHSFPSPMAGQGVSSGPQSVEGWDDGMMWELFDNQPSLEWVDSALWDTMTQLDVPLS